MATISGCGCCVVDYLWLNVDFNSSSFQKYESKISGDGGLCPGQLSFVEALEFFAKVPLQVIRKEQGWDREPDKCNLGGPCIVALVNAAQLTSQSCNKKNVKYFGVIVKDKAGERILSFLHQTPVDVTHYRYIDGESPYCICLSDPNYNNGHGERCFILQLGFLRNITPCMLGEDFFKSEILYFGATASCFALHDNLTSLLRCGKEHNCINVVGTVFDHRNESKQLKRWPTGESDESFQLMDLLMVDWDEALRITGASCLSEAVTFLQQKGVKSFTITHGPEDAYAWSNGDLFAPLALTAFPICNKVLLDLQNKPEKRGDTTGCGDNFAGGILAYLSEALGNKCKRGQLNMIEAMSWGMASGAFALFSIGGTYIEKEPGEKRKLINAYRQDYLKQLKSAKL